MTGRAGDGKLGFRSSSRLNDTSAQKVHHGDWEKDLNKKWKTMRSNLHSSYFDIYKLVILLKKIQRKRIEKLSAIVQAGQCITVLLFLSYIWPLMYIQDLAIAYLN